MQGCHPRTKTSSGSLNEMHNHVNSNFKHMFVFVGQAYFSFLLHNDMQAREDEGGGARWRGELNCSLVRRTQNFVRSEIAELVPILSLVNSHLTCFENLHFLRLFRNLISISIMKRFSYKVVGSTTEIRGHCPIFRKAFLQNHSTKPQIHHPDFNGATCRRRFNQGS